MEEFDTEKEHIGLTSAKGVAALASRTFILNLISFATSLVIFTILTPRDVGVYVAVIAIQRVVSFFTDFGFGAALIQKKDKLTREDTTTTFTLQSSVTLAIFVIIFVLKDFIARGFNLANDAVILLLVLVFTIFVSSFKTIPSIVLERKIHFHKLIFPQIVESLVFNAILLFLVSVVLARIIPTIILPLFYKIIPIENEELKLRINKLAVNAGIKVENVYSFDMSKNTKKANAAFTGLGKSKRIILGDTLLNNFSLDEIETVIAHELGHYKKKHILKNIIIGTVSSFLTLFLISLLYDNTLGLFGFKDRSAIAAFPLISIWAMIIGLIQLPFTNMISRKFEYEADNYSILVTKKPQVFADALNKLNKQNLGDENPHPLVEWYFNSHPSVSRRIKKIELSL